MEDFPVEGSAPDDGPAEAASEVVAAAAAPAPDDEVSGSREEAAFDPVTGDPVEAPIEDPVAEADPIGIRSRSARRWRNVVLVMGLVLAVMIGATGSILSSTADGGPAQVAAASPSLALPSPAGSPTATLISIPSAPTPSENSSPTGAAPTPGVTAGESPAPTPTATPAPLATGNAAPATLTFRDLMLDSAADPGGLARTFTFTSDGPGSVSAQVVTAAPLANSKMCIQANGDPQRCKTGATPGFVTVAPNGNHAQWTVTLIATDAGSTPVVDVAFTWRTNAPAITLSHGRLQGAPNPDSLRGVTVTFTDRAAGSLSVATSWAPSPVDASLTLADVTSGPGSKVDGTSYAAAASITPAYTHAVKARKTYELALRNTGADDGRSDLSITIAFP